MAINMGIQQGRLPFDLKVFNEGDDKKMVVMGTISVRRSYKPEGEQYYPEDLLDFKAFGKTAKFINDYFKKGDNIILTSELRRNDNYEKDGETVHGQMYLHVVSADFQQGGGAGEGGGSSKPTGTAAKATGTSGKPAAPKKTNPLAGGARRSFI